MTDLAPTKVWWSAAELEAAGLPDLPATKRRINDLAAREGWGNSPSHARRRSGRGGGTEYHWSLLPVRAQQRLLLEAKAIPEAPVKKAKVSRDDAWAVYEGLPAKPKADAQRRLGVIQQVEALQANGATKFNAVADIARMSSASERTIYNWFALIDGVRGDDRLAYLAPAHRTPTKKRKTAVFHPDFKAVILADFLRPEAPSLTSVYDRCVRIAEAKGWDVLPIHTVRRWIKENVSFTTLILAREGFDALMRRRPAQIRDKSSMHAMEGVNGDFHRFDVFVRFPATPSGEPEAIIRPQMCAFQDIFSGKILAHRLDRTPNSPCVQLTIGDMIEDWGIPSKVLLDNGREFAAKLITGGARTRYRFKVKEEDPSGLLTALGCETVWAMPYSGQSKPIERAFRDMCDRIAKHPVFAGAYTGNRPDAKPENYGQKAIPLDVFQTILDEEIAAHNARGDRRSEVAYGRSFDDVFNESYATAPIKKATSEQRRLWLMGAEGIKTNSRTGQINFMRNRYYEPWLSDHSGERVVIRFDRDNLHDGVHVYSGDDAYLGFAPCVIPSGFFSTQDSRVTAKAKASFVKARKEELAAYRQLAKVQDVAAHLRDIAPDEVERPVATVVRPVFEKPAPKPAPDPTPEEVAARAAVVADLDAYRAPITAAEEERETYLCAAALLRDVEQGTPITADQTQWLDGYTRTPSYRALRGIVQDFGEEFLAKK